jgi:predicted O-methyltransferase YrrM
LNDDQITAEWKKSDNQPSLFSQPDGTGGVNLGDCRAIFHLVRGLRVKSVLEIGTHIGAYTVQIARALSLYGDESYKCSVDISDVNSTSAKHWLANNASHSPREEVNLAGVGENVEFFILRR